MSENLELVRSVYADWDRGIYRSLAWAHPEIEWEFVDAERVLVLTRFWGRGTGSGLEVAKAGSNGASLFEIHDGLTVRLTLYGDRQRALADLGLAE